MEHAARKDHANIIILYVRRARRHVNRAPCGVAVGWIVRLLPGGFHTVRFYVWRCGSPLRMCVYVCVRVQALGTENAHRADRIDDPLDRNAPDSAITGTADD